LELQAAAESGGGSVTWQIDTEKLVNDYFRASQRPVRRPKASVELPRNVAEHSIAVLRSIEDGTSVYPAVSAGALADVFAAALEQAKAEDRR
jgi:hypothetical protein